MNENRFKVLITDDKSDFTKECAELFKGLGYSVSLCEKRGDKVINELENTGYDAVIMDVFMPVADGLEVLEKISANLVKRPVAALLSAINSPVFEEQMINAGADYYFIKPAEAKTVVKRVEGLVNWQSQKGKRKGYVKRNNLDVVISDALCQIGVPAHIKGYQYLRCAIMMTVNNPDLINSVTKELYPAVAKEFSTTSLTSPKCSARSQSCFIPRLQRSLTQLRVGLNVQYATPLRLRGAGATLTCFRRISATPSTRRRASRQIRNS